MLQVANQSSSQNEGIDTNNSLNYPLPAVSLHLSKWCNTQSIECKLFDAAINDLDVWNSTSYQMEKPLYIYFIDLAAAIRRFHGTVETIRQLPSKILSCIQQRTALKAARENSVMKVKDQSRYEDPFRLRSFHAKW